MKTLTSSQWHSLAAGIIGAASWLVSEAPRIEAIFPSVRWLAPTIGIVAYGVTMASRGLKTSTSGTGVGILSTGPDADAQAAQTGSGPEPQFTPSAPQFTPSAPPLDPIEQELYQVALDFATQQRQKAVADAAALIRGATMHGLDSKTLAAGHMMIAALNGGTATEEATGGPQAGAQAIQAPPATPAPISEGAPIPLPESMSSGRGLLAMPPTPLMAQATPSNTGPAAEPVYPAGEGA